MTLSLTASRLTQEARQQEPMMAFQLDTSGEVHGAGRWDAAGKQWQQLDPFTQGYVEALFASIADVKTPWGAGYDVVRALRFSDLAPETLARIMEDCATYCKGHHRQRVHTSETEGGSFWRIRQAAGYIRDGRFPPLTPYLGDDGLIYVREAR